MKHLITTWIQTLIYIIFNGVTARTIHHIVLISVRIVWLNINPRSFLHNNVRSLKKNLEAFQNQLLNELSYQFTILAVTETKIVGDKPLDFNPDIPGYNFEYVSTPLSAGGVGIYILENLKYSVLEKTSNIYYQSIIMKF